MNKTIFEPIGVIRSPFHDVEGMPVQTIGALGVKGTVEIRADLEPGLKDLDGFSHVVLISIVSRILHDRVCAESAVC